MVTRHLIPKGSENKTFRVRHRLKLEDISWHWEALTFILTTSGASPSFHA